MSAYRKRFKRATILDEVVHTNPNIPAQQLGGAADVSEGWRVHYKAKKWNSVAAFDNKGRLGHPYILSFDRIGQYRLSTLTGETDTPPPTRPPGHPTRPLPMRDG